LYYAPVIINSDQMKDYKMGRTCSMRIMFGKCIQNFSQQMWIEETWL